MGYELVSLRDLISFYERKFYEREDIDHNNITAKARKKWVKQQFNDFISSFFLRVCSAFVYFNSVNTLDGNISVTACLFAE